MSSPFITLLVTLNIITMSQAKQIAAIVEYYKVKSEAALDTAAADKELVATVADLKAKLATLVAEAEEVQVVIDKYSKNIPVAPVDVVVPAPATVEPAPATVEPAPATVEPVANPFIIQYPTV